MKMSAEINELAAALSAAQGEFTSAEREHVANVLSKKGEGSSYSYNYADLASYLDVCRAPLAKAGLSFVQEAITDGPRVSVATLLLHKSGQWIQFDPLTLSSGDGMPQSVGSAITYGRRYSLSAATGMASEADDDGNQGQGNLAETGPRENNLPPCPKCGTNKSVIVGRPEFGGGFVCFSKKGGCGEKWQAEQAKTNGHEPKTNGGKSADTKKQRKDYEQSMSAEDFRAFTDKVNAYTERITKADSLMTLDDIASELKSEDQKIVGVISPLGKARRQVLTNEPKTEQFA